MAVYDATYDDIDQVTGLIADFYLETSYDAPLINEHKTKDALGRLLDARAIAKNNVFFQVLANQGWVQGVIIAERVEDVWSDLRVVVEHLIYVRSPYRGSAAAGRLLYAFKDWAEAQPSAIRAQASSGINDPAVFEMYKKMGWHERGRIFGKEVV